MRGRISSGSSGSRFLNVLREELDHLILGQPPGGYAQRERLDVIVAGQQLAPIDEQEDFGRRNGDTFVAVHERMIGAEMEVVGRRFLRLAGVKIDPAERGLRHGDGGFQKPAVTQTGIATEFLNDSAMDL